MSIDYEKLSIVVFEILRQYACVRLGGAEK